MRRAFADLTRAWIALLAVVGASAVASAQEERSFSERFAYGGEVLLNGSPDDPGNFNELEYERNLLRLVRLNLALSFDAPAGLSFLTEIRSDNFDVPEAYALFVRFRPWRARAFDLQAGRIPPVFGAFARRQYGADNPLIGTPLAYQYPTTVRPDAAPSDLSQVLDQRGHGVFVRYPLGNRARRAGLPILNPLRWDTGVQARLGTDPLSLAVALTQGTISNPRVGDDNGGKQLAGRLAWRPVFGATLGFSAARGSYVTDTLREATGEDGHQLALGADAELARHHLLVRAEVLWSRWDAPTLETGPLGTLAVLAEASYKLTPGFYVALRLDHMAFDDVATPSGTETWESPITRIEVGVGYHFHRRVLGKASFQYNDRQHGEVQSRAIPAAQLLVWF